MPCASSCSAAVTTSSTERLWPEVDHLGAHALQDAPHDVDRRVVAVEQAAAVTKRTLWSGGTRRGP